MTLFKQNSVLRTISSGYKRTKSVVKIEKGNTLNHELLKFLVCFILKNRKYEFMTEVRFVEGGRADIIDLDNQIIYEVLVTEKEENIDIKREMYPNFEIVPICHQHYAELTPQEIVEKLEKVIM